MRELWLIMRKDLRRKLRSPLSTIAMLLFPILFSLLIGLAFGSGGKMPPVRLALVDQDGGMGARLLTSSFSQAKMTPALEPVTADSAEGIRLVEKNKVSGMVRIPAGFTDSLLQGGTTYLEVVRNPAQGIYPTILEQYIKVLAQLGGGAVRILEAPLHEISQTIKGSAAPQDLWVSQLSVQINRKFRSIGRYALPPRIALEKPAAPAGAKKEESGPFHIAVFVLPGMAAYALLMLGIVHMADFQRERAHGTLARQILTPIPAGSVILGKIGATWLVSLAAILILAVLAVLWAKVAISLAGFCLLSLCVALAATGFGAFVQCLSRSERAGSVLGSILALIMSMAGGSMIPLEVLPSFVRRIAPFTLTYWAGEGYRKLVFEGAGFTQLGHNYLILAAIGVIFSGFAAWRMRRMLSGGV
jgi:ABC-2 type transport system permease protein